MMTMMMNNPFVVGYPNTDTLINRCLECIAKSFPQYNLKIFDNLPKTVRKSLFHKLCSRGLVDDGNIRCFVDEGTRVLDLRDCSNISDRGLALIEGCKYVTKIDLTLNSGERSEITVKGIGWLTQHCPFVTCLLMPKCINIDDAAVGIVSKAYGKRLNQLSISHCHLITDNALDSLGKWCIALRAIDLSFTNIQDVGIMGLMSPSVRSTIEEIHIGNCKHLTDMSIEAILVNSKRIKFLLFHGCPRLTSKTTLSLIRGQRESCLNMRMHNESLFYTQKHKVRPDWLWMTI